MTSQLVHLNKGNFAKALQNGHKTVLVDFWAPWCGPCRMIVPELEALSEKVSEDTLIAKVNVDENPELAQAYDVHSIPNLVLFKEGKPVKRLVGFQTRQALLNALV